MSEPSASAMPTATASEPIQMRPDEMVNLSGRIPAFEGEW
jgi:hypothetical protein